MQYQPSGSASLPPLYAPTPMLQPVHPTPFYIEDILGRGAQGPPPPTLPSPNSSFTSLVASYRTPIYEPTPIHPAFSHPLTAATYGSGPYGAAAGPPLYPFPRAVGDYSHALLRHDPLGYLELLIGANLVSEAVKYFPGRPELARLREPCTLLIILSTSSIQTHSGNTRLLIARIRFSDIGPLPASARQQSRAKAGPRENHADSLRPTQVPADRIFPASNPSR
ncbi:hypothetical protein Chor_013914 [Crotalus horridus]